MRSNADSPIDPGVRWEYLIVKNAELESLGELGRKGWELVTVLRGDAGLTLFFKRPIQGKVTP